MYYSPPLPFVKNVNETLEACRSFLDGVFIFVRHLVNEFVEYAIFVKSII